MEDIQKYLNIIMWFLKELDFSDHVLIWISLFFWVLFFLIWFEKLQKAYLGIILWLFIFSIINLSLFSLNDSDIWVNFIRDYLISNRDFISVYSIYFIPLLALVLPFNWVLNFKSTNLKIINYLLSFILGFFFIWFFITIILSIINNRFLFSLDVTLLESLKSIFFVDFIFSFFTDSKIYPFLITYDYIFNLIIIVFIFYKLTFGWFFSFLMVVIIWLFKVLIKKIKEAKAKEAESNDWE